MLKERLKLIKKAHVKTFYHVSDPSNIPSILDNGLKLCKKGMLFLFNNKKDAWKIAVNQCGLWENYALFSVSVDEDDLEIDNVAELIIGKQYFTKNPISKTHVNLVGCSMVIMK